MATDADDDDVRTGKVFYNHFWDLMKKGAVDLVPIKGGVPNKGPTKEQE